MKNILVILTLLPTMLTPLWAQQAAPCWFDEYQRREAPRVGAAEKIIRTYLENDAQRTSHGVKVIPVVVHVIHNGGTENISDAQILSQIEVLNEDFRKMAGTNGDGNGVDTEVEFCLAKISPDGNCTNGIVRVQSTLTTHLTYQRAQLKQLSYWDNKKYLNMYVVKSINGNSGIAGYASFPGGPPDEDGIVVRHNYFGKTGTAATTLGRTTTHEIAHWFGLYHTFNNGCGTDTCTDGDYICDTPPVANPNFGCPTINSCSNDQPDLPDQVDNYCDYSDDGCKSQFTAGQKDRMHATLNTLRTVIWSQANLQATGCDTDYVAPAVCMPVADFGAINTDICRDGTVTFFDRTMNGPVTWAWTFPGGTPATSTSASPTVTYANPGQYTVTLVVTGANGSDTLEITDYITVEAPVPGQPAAWGDGFESTTFPFGALSIDNPDNGITWERTTAAAYEGVASARIRNLVNTNYGQSDALVLPRIDFTALPTPVKLSFKWAYARSDANFSDELIVLVSDDCGNNWDQKFYRTGNGLATGPTQTTTFVPDDSQWKSANIDLTAYTGSDHVDIKIVNVTDGGNALYIDSLTLGNYNLGSLDVDEQETAPAAVVYPNPVLDKLAIRVAPGSPPVNEMYVTDVYGKRLLQVKKPNTDQTWVDVAAYPAGVYVLGIKTGNTVSFYRFIKQ